MAARIEYTTTLSAAVTNGVCLSQTPAGAGALTINGSLATAGLATLDAGTVNHARQVLFTFAANESARTFIVSGTVLEGGATVTESVTGTATTATTVNYFITVSSITVDAATAGALQVGTNGVGSSKWRVVDRHFAPETTIVCDIETGTATYGIQFTADDLFKSTVIPLARDHATIVSQTGAADGNFGKPVMGMRTKISTGTGSVRTAVLPSTTQV